VRSFLRYATLPIRRYADFSGRARRAELVAFWVLVTVVEEGPALVVPFSPAGRAIFALLVTTVFVLPIAALFVRRVHDVGFSGWWLAPLIPIAAHGLWENVQAIADPYEITGPSPTLIDVLGLAFGLAAALMLFWNDQVGENRFGPNPRDAAGPAQPG
jgi:uncharacterized membrane protein YhaH (DUF805 family)